MTKTDVYTDHGVTVITSKELINASKEKVWDALKMIGEIEKFHPLVKKSHTTTDLPGGMGAKRHCTLLPMGQMEEEVVLWNEETSFEMVVVGGKMLPPYRFMKGRVDLAELEGKTELTFAFSYQLKFGVFGRLMDSFLIRPQFKKGPPQYVTGLKNFVEAR